MNRQEAHQIAAGLLEKVRSSPLEKIVSAQGTSTSGNVAGQFADACQFKISISELIRKNELRVTAVVDYVEGGKAQRAEKHITVTIRT